MLCFWIFPVRKSVSACGWSVGNLAAGLCRGIGGEPDHRPQLLTEGQHIIDLICEKSAGQVTVTGPGFSDPL